METANSLHDKPHNTSSASTSLPCLHQWPCDDTLHATISSLTSLSHHRHGCRRTPKKNDILLKRGDYRMGLSSGMCTMEWDSIYITNLLVYGMHFFAWIRAPCQHDARLMRAAVCIIYGCRILATPAYFLLGTGPVFVGTLLPTSKMML